jgi:hypothetical protein
MAGSGQEGFGSVTRKKRTPVCSDQATAPGTGPGYTNAQRKGGSRPTPTGYRM